MAVAGREFDAEPPAAERVIQARSPGRMIWRRFRRHRLARASLVVLAILYLVAIFAPFIAYSDPHRSNAFLGNVPPQTIYWFRDGEFRPHVHAVVRKRNPQTFRVEVTTDPTVVHDLALFVRGYEYRILGLFRTDRHLIGVKGAETADTLFLLGTDALGRDLFSRLVVASQVSLTIGLVGVVLSLVIGVTLGGLSGYFGGWVDVVVQRLIEIMQSVPTIPLWMGLAAALPREWSVVQVYFAITLIISVLGWTELARVVRGRFLAIRSEDYIVAAELAGASRARIVFRHMLPSFTSHLIAATTLAIPLMIISETTLSFLGLGLRPPAISWGVLLKDAQNIQSIATAPWLMFAMVPVVVTVLAFNFLGDGLRDAADPYS